MHNKQPNINFSWLIKHPISLIAFGFGVGLAPKAPGTIGSLLGVLLALIFYYIGLEPSIIFYTSIIFFIIGVPVCHYCELAIARYDYKGIVWDEIVAMILVLSFTPYNYLFWIIAFILFRIFDICKPWPISFLDKEVKGGLGIMLDDLIAAVFSIIIIKIIVMCLYER